MATFQRRSSDTRIKRGACIQLPCNRATLVFTVATILIICQIILTDFYSLVINGQFKQSPILRIMTTYLSQPGHNEFHDSSGTNYQNLTMVGNGEFYIYSVIAEQSVTESEWTSIAFNGWEHRDASEEKYNCCFKHVNGSVLFRKKYKKIMKWNKTTLIAKQIVCDITDVSKPDLAGLVLANESCKTDAVFRQVLYRKRQEKPKFAICAKIAYGNKNPIELIEWMEYHLHFGASAVVIYPYYDLNLDAMKVLNYYANREQIEMVPLPRVPLSDTVRRNFAVASHMKDQDEQVPNYDTQERLQRYRYYTIIDTDEFIVPGNNTNITNFVQLMEYLTETYKNAGTFQMLTEIHLMDWEKTNNNSELVIAQQGFHTEPRRITTKFLHVTDRIVPGTVWIHGAAVKPGFKKYIADPGDVVLKHYRFCKNRWFFKFHDQKLCVDHFEKIKGHFMEKVVKLIAPRVLEVKKYLNID